MQKANFRIEGEEIESPAVSPSIDSHLLQVEDQQIQEIVENFNSLHKSHFIEGKEGQDTRQNFNQKAQANASSVFPQRQTDNALYLVEFLKDRLFKLNFALMQLQPITTPIYLIILIVEFLQILWLTTISVTVNNEFAIPAYTKLNVTSYIPQLLKQAIGPGGYFNQTYQSQRLEEMIRNGQTAQLIESSFRLDSFFEWANPALYFISTDFSGVGAIAGVSGSNKAFFVVYALLIGFFFGVIVAGIMLAQCFFRLVKKENFKESTKMLIRLISALLFLLFSFLTVPFLTLSLQGLQCDESPLLQYTQQGISCSGSQHKVLFFFSVFSLLVYLCSAYAYLSLHQPREAGHRIPWSGLDRNLMFFKVLLKFELTAAFVFDKSELYKVEFILVAFAVMCYLMYRRFTNAIIFNTRVHVIAMSLDLANCTFLLLIPLQKLFEREIYLSTVVGMIVVAIMAQLLFLWAQQNRRLAHFEDDWYLINSRPVDAEVHIMRKFAMVEKGDPGDFIFFLGKLYDHLEACDIPVCECSTLTKKYDAALKKLEAQLDKQVNGIPDDEDFNQHTQQEQRGLQKLMANDIIIRAGSQSSVIEMNNNPQSSQYPGSVLYSGKLYQIPGNSQNQILLQTSQLLMEVDQPMEQTGDSSSKSLMPTATLKPTSQPQSIGNPPDQGSNVSQVPLSLVAKDLLTYDQEFEEDGSLERNLDLRELSYLFINIQLSQKISKYPKSIALRLLQSQLYQNRLKNGFKAIFELILCETMNPSLLEAFTIFRKKQEIEIELLRQHTKQLPKENLDVKILFEHQKAFLRFQRYETLAAHAALSFWRELSLKNFNATRLKLLGVEISQSYQVIQESADQILKISPFDLRFHFNYGMFLIKVLNNKFEGLDNLKKAQLIFQKKKCQVGGDRQFGTNGAKYAKNSGAVIVILSAQSRNLGKIIHVNDEIEALLGFKRNEVLNDNVSCLMPRIMAQYHDSFIRRYVDTGVKKLIDKERQSFAEAKSQQLIPIDLLVKVFPKICGQIVFMGVISKSVNYLEMNAPELEYRNMDQHYILTDIGGNISNVSLGLLYQLGLHPKFFNYSVDHLLSLISIEKLCGEVLDPRIQQRLEHEGLVLNFNTKAILSSIELEKFATEEIHLIKSKVCECSVYVQLKRFQAAKETFIHIYRLIILKSNGQDFEESSRIGESRMNDLRQILQMKRKAALIGLQVSNNLKLGEQHSRQSSSISSQMEHQSTNSAASSSSSSFGAGNSSIRDFKKSLNERTTPKTLLYLNRMMCLILLVTIIMATAVYTQLQSDIDFLKDENLNNIQSERRLIRMVQLAVNVRNFINIANNFGKNDFTLPALNEIIERKAAQRLLIINQQKQLQEIQNFMTKMGQVNRNEIYFQQRDFESTPITLLEIDITNRLLPIQQNYRQALNAYLNDVLMINLTDTSLLYFSDDIMTLNPNPGEKVYYSSTTYVQKQGFKIMVNGMRVMRYFTQLATENIKKLSYSSNSLQTLMIIMIISVAITAASFVTIFYQFLQIEHLQRDILSLYAYLRLESINEVHLRTQSYMEEIVKGSFINKIEALYEGAYEGKHHKRDKQGPPLQFACEQSSEGHIFQQEKVEMQLSKSSEISQAMLEGHTLQHLADYQSRDIYQMMIRRSVQEMKVIAYRDQQREQARITRLSKSGGQQIEAKIKNRVKQRNNAKNSKRSSLYDASKQKQAAVAPIRSSILNETKPESGVRGKRKQLKKFIKLTKGRKVIRVKAEQEDDPTASKSANENRNSFEESKDNMFREYKQGGIEDDTSRSQDNFDPLKALTKTKKTKEPAEETDSSKSALDAIEERKLQFKLTFKNSNMGRKLGAIFFCLIGIGFFLEMYFSHLAFVDSLLYIQDIVPVFLNRYRHAICMVGMLRDRIIYNNSLTSYEPYDGYGYNADVYFKDKSFETELDIIRTFQNHREVVKDLVNLGREFDSQNFCSAVVANTISSADQEIRNIGKEAMMYGTDLDVPEYEGIINTVFAACEAARLGDLESLKHMHAVGSVDLNLGDYDLSSPLFYAVKVNNFNVVKYLVEEVSVEINKVDRWGATALDYARNEPDIYRYLKEKGADSNLANLSYSYVMPGSQYRLSKSQVRMLYAVQYNDLVTVRKLDTLNVPLGFLDYQGRTPLHIAASEGHLDIVKYILARNVAIGVKDAFGNEARDDANINGNTHVSDLLNEIETDTIVGEQCKLFFKGVFSNGMASAIGAYQKKFSDFHLLLASTNDYYKRLSLHRTARFQSKLPADFVPFNQTLITEFMQAEELYFTRAIMQLELTASSIYENFAASYEQQAQTIYTLYAVCMVLVLIYFRERMIGRMRDDIFESRGVLNLIPSHFFEENKQQVETFIKKLRK